MKVSNNKSNSN